jgi:hypothetical protein
MWLIESADEELTVYVTTSTGQGDKEKSQHDGRRIVLASDSSDLNLFYVT